jgi:hypothetical protein
VEQATILPKFHASRAKPSKELKMTGLFFAKRGCELAAIGTIF